LNREIEALFKLDRSGMRGVQKMIAGAFGFARLVAERKKRQRKRQPNFPACLHALFRQP
jgi:hypothetical protein